MKLKPHAFSGEEVLCHLVEIDALIDTKYKTPRPGTDSVDFPGKETLRINTISKPGRFQPHCGFLRSEVIC